MNYCTGLKSTLVLVGHFVFIAKIFIPIVIIGLGMMDMFKAVTAQKDEEIKKAFIMLAKRIGAGVMIFFLPAFIDLIFSWISSWSSDYSTKYQECFKCVWNVNDATCK